MITRVGRPDYVLFSVSPWALFPSRVLVVTVLPCIAICPVSDYDKSL